MNDPNQLTDPNATPEDVATLYSWANLHGAKYRDFSAARAQTREKTRLRAEQAEQALEEEQRNSRQAADAVQATEAERAAQEAQARQAEQAAEQAAQHAEWAAQQAAQQAADLVAQRAAQRAAEQAARSAAEQDAQREAQQAAELAARRARERAAQQAAQKAAQQAAEWATQQHVWQQPRADRSSAPSAPLPVGPYDPPQPQSFNSAEFSQPQAYRPGSSLYPGQAQYAPPREDSSLPRNTWATPDLREPVGRPAWLTADHPETPKTPNSSTPQSSLQQAPEDTLQGSRDRLTSRWFALRGVFDATPAQVEVLPPPLASRAPAMAVFSLAGGVGKTSLVATLGRALSARGERVLLVDTAAFGLLPFFFGATDQRPGLLRTFSPPGTSSDAPIQMVTIDPEGLNPETPNQESLSGEIAKFTRGVGRIIVDLATASGATTRRIMRMSPLVLVPVVPDMNSVVSVSSIDAFFEHNGNPAGKPAMPFYLLNQFDASLPLHLDVREVLREQLGERLLPFALRRTPAMSEALAEGMTVMDYAPGSALAEDFATLAAWVKSLSAPATTSYRGVRWSER